MTQTSDEWRFAEIVGASEPSTDATDLTAGLPELTKSERNEALALLKSENYCDLILVPRLANRL